MDQIAGKYRVIKTLGQGAMGEVFLVLPPQGDPVALKLLKTLDEKASHNAVDQFENEFKVLKKLSHPNIGKIFDYGYDNELKKVFFTLPWLKGTDIYTHTKNINFEDCEAIFVEVLRALNYLHQKGLQHCDLKPGNIYIENGKALLIDFGLTGYFGDFVVGTPTYLAPEIFQGGKHNVQSDLYAIGIIFYNCLTRTQPFSGKTLQEVYDRHRTLTPPPIHEINIKVPRYFSEIVATLLNKKPGERFPSAAAVIEDIATFSSHKYTVETSETLLSYIPTSSELIGRTDVLLELQNAINAFCQTAPDKPFHLMLIQGKKNTGRTRVVEKVKNDLQLAKVAVEEVFPPLDAEHAQIVTRSQAIVLQYLDSYQADPEAAGFIKNVLEIIEQKILSPDTSRFLLIVTATHEQDFAVLRKLFPPENTLVTEVELPPYTLAEMEEFLVSVIGQKEIPRGFLEQFYSNTQGLPGMAHELIQSMIENGLLFDPSGRWNEDLLADLNKAFDRLTVSESLEQEFEKIYSSLNDTESNLVNWLALCPHRLTHHQVTALMKGLDAEAPLNALKEKAIVREEPGGYSLYRNIFQNFVKNNLPVSEVKKRHTHLARPEIGLEQDLAIQHLSLGHDNKLAIMASEKLAQIRVAQGDRANAVEIYEQLLSRHAQEDIRKRLLWVIELSTLLIWLDRFREAVKVISKIENELNHHKSNIDFKHFLTLLEKKGLALLHQQEIDKARVYFENGLKFAVKNQEYATQQLRFENDLAEIEMVTGKLDRAIDIFKRTRAPMARMSASEIETITNNDLGHVYLQKQDYDKSLVCLTEDIRLFSRLVNKEPLARALYSFAQVLQMKRLNEKAIRAYEECIRLCKPGHFFPLLLRAYNGLGNLYVSLKDHVKALENYQRALELSVRLGDVTAKAALLFNQGFIYRKDKNLALATRRFLTAIQVLKTKDKKLAYDSILLSQCYNALGVIFIEDNNPLKALNFFLERKNLAISNQAPREEVLATMLDLAECQLKNRLKEPFLAEITALKALAQTLDESSKVKSLEEEWKNVEAFAEQDATGRINLTS